MIDVNDPRVRTVVEQMNGDPSKFYADVTCALAVQFAQALVKAGVLAAGERFDGAVEEYEGLPRLFISVSRGGLTPRYTASERMHLGAEAYVPEVGTVHPTPGQVELMCLSVQDVINGRLETGDAAADLATAKEHLATALFITGFRSDV